MRYTLEFEKKCAARQFTDGTQQVGLRLVNDGDVDGGYLQYVVTYMNVLGLVSPDDAKSPRFWPAVAFAAATEAERQLRRGTLPLGGTGPERRRLVVVDVSPIDVTRIARSDQPLPMPLIEGETVVHEFDIPSPGTEVVGGEAPDPVLPSSTAVDPANLSEDDD